MANSHKLPSGQVIPTESESQVRDAIRLAARARQDLGDGGGWDDPRLRAHLSARAKAHGIPHIIPPDWKHEPAGKSAGRWNEDRLVRETRNAVYDVAKRSGCAVRSMEIEMTTPAEAAEALSKAFEYRRMADQITDRATADGYRQLAKKVLREAGMA